MNKKVFLLWSDYKELTVCVLTEMKIQYQCNAAVKMN